MEYFDSTAAAVIWALSLVAITLVVFGLFLYFLDAPDKHKHLKWIWHFWKPHAIWIWVLGLLTLVSSAATLAFPKVLGYVIDSVKLLASDSAGQAGEADPLRLVWVIAAIGLARSVANLYPGTRAMLNARIEMGVREHYFAKILAQGHSFFQKFRTGDLVTRLTDDIGGFPKIAWFCCSGVFRAVESSSKFIFCLAFMLLINWKLALFTLIPLPVMLYLFYRVRTAMSSASQARQKIISQTNDELEAAFSGIRILKAFCGEQNQSRQFNTILKERIGVELRLMRLWMGMHNIFMGVTFVGQIIVIVAGGYMVIHNTLSVGDFFAFYIYITLLLPPLMDIPNLFVTSRQAFACIDREVELGSLVSDELQVDTGLETVSQIDSVELRDVCFSYDSGLPDSLSKVNLTLKAGQKIAVIGQVGSGKSTLLKTVAGLLPPTSGEVLVNGKPISSININSYRSHTGYIPQEATLFSESVEDNVSFGRQLADGAVDRALALARIREEMETLPDGLQQVLGQRGMTVSGGQKQRLAIARALAGKPDLLLMDDCTSALDAQNERAFWDEFTLHLPDSACLIVTHRLATARQADLIYVLSEGKVVGSGTHAALLADCEEYRNFLTREELQAALAAQ